MVSSILKQAAEIMRKRKEGRKWQKVVLCLALVAVAGTITVLMTTGRALTDQDDQDELILDCEYKVHEHTEDCEDEDGNIVCGFADFVIHEHNDYCYDSEGELVCKLPEIEIHEHEETCYSHDPEIAPLVCEIVTDAEAEVAAETETAKKEESSSNASHSSGSSSGTEEVKTCGKEEHTHNGGCYETEEVRNCSSDDENHEHDDSCNTTKKKLTCSKEEHTHSDDCYSTVAKNDSSADDEEPVSVASAEPAAESTESGEANDSSSDETLTGTVDDNAGNDAADTTVDNNTDNEGAVDAAVDNNTDNEGTVDGTAEVTIDADAETEVVGPHVHDESCYKLLICEEEVFELHTHIDDPEDENCCYEVFYNEETGEISMGNRPICGKLQLEEHNHTEDCLGLNPNKIYTQVFEGDGFIVTAEYTRAAKIPDDSLFAEMIEEDDARYAGREEEYKNIVEDENASMCALMDIGFYVNGEEIQPKVPVTITVQFLDEDRLPKGRPIKIVHFAEGGAEEIKGSEVEDQSTTFEMTSFSVIALGYTAPEGSIYVSQSFSYKDDAFDILFHVEGNALPADGEKALPADAKDIVTDEVKEVITDEVPEAEEMFGSEEVKDETEAENIADVEEDKETGDSTDKAVVDDEDADEAETADADDEKVDTADTDEKETADVDEEADAEDETEVSEDADAAEDQNEADEEEVVSDSEDELQFRLDHVDEDSEEYKPFAEYAEETGNIENQLMLRVMSYAVYYEDIKLDVSDCTVTAEIKPAKTLKKYVEGNVPKAASYVDENTEEVGRVVVATALQMMNNQVAESAIMTLADDGIPYETMIVTLDDDIVAVNVEDTTNPSFTVQYYANLDITKSSNQKGNKDNALAVIDTSGNGDGKGGKLPINKTGENITATRNVSPTDNSLKYIFLNDANQVETESTLTKVYSSRNYEYIKAPSINYFNALIENTSYNLKEIWVLKNQYVGNANKAEGINKGDWDIYEYNETLHFTNREIPDASKQQGHRYVPITDNTIVRLVYEVNRNPSEFKAEFYDYDISDGKVYENQDLSGGSINSSDLFNGDALKHSAWKNYYINTYRQGINSDSNYTSGVADNGKLAFGNGNAGSGLGRVYKANTSPRSFVDNVNYWKDGNGNYNNLNTYNRKRITYQGCTFGLASGISPEGTIVYASGVNAPNLFNDGSAIGKTSYTDYSLNFKRSGDTYTLSAVTGTTTGNLDLFNHPKSSTGIHYDIWTNNFWPMDSAPSCSKKYQGVYHDIKFGHTNTFIDDQLQSQGKDYSNVHGLGYGPNTDTDGDHFLPESDDGLYHNSYFGMHYEVNFDLVKDYVGPLEYYFFGDDDMWVFLSKVNPDGTLTDSKLVCDIGGVHSSVGEYVNLWDYLKKGEAEGTYALNFFYTERGASGSTCWMQFTLPSVTSMTPETTQSDYGHLKIDKTVMKSVMSNGTEEIGSEEFDTGEEFEFTISFQKGGERLTDDYSYTIYTVKQDEDENDTESSSGVIEWDSKGTAHDGTIFRLRHNQYIEIKYLPVDTVYTITEKNGVVLGSGTTTGNKDYVYHTTKVTVDDKKRDANGKEINDPKPEVTFNDEAVKTVSGTIGANMTSEVNYVNICSVYALPKTGGLGVDDYLRTGILLVVLSVTFCFIYSRRKNARGNV